MRLCVWGNKKIRLRWLLSRHMTMICLFRAHILALNFHWKSILDLYRMFNRMIIWSNIIIGGQSMKEREKETIFNLLLHIAMCTNCYFCARTTEIQSLISFLFSILDVLCFFTIRIAEATNWQRSIKKISRVSFFSVVVGKSRGLSSNQSRLWLSIKWILVTLRVKWHSRFFFFFFSVQD